MTELIQMAPLIKNSFYLLDACLFIYSYHCLHKQPECECVCVCVCVCEALGGEWRYSATSGVLLLCFLEVSPFEYVTCVVPSDGAHVRVFGRACMSVRARVFARPNFHIV